MTRYFVFLCFEHNTNFGTILLLWLHKVLLVEHLQPENGHTRTQNVFYYSYGFLCLLIVQCWLKNEMFLTSKTFYTTFDWTLIVLNWAKKNVLIKNITKISKSDATLPTNVKFNDYSRRYNFRYENLKSQ